MASAMASVVQANHTLNRMAAHLCGAAINPLRFVPHLRVSESSKLRYGHSLRKAGEYCSPRLAK